MFVEPESPQVRAVPSSRSTAGDLLIAPELAWVEVARSLSRAGVSDIGDALAAACVGTARHPLDPAVLTRSCTVGPANLRLLDAIHLAAAVSVAAVEILTFDRRLAEAAESVGIRAIS